MSRLFIFVLFYIFARCEKRPNVLFIIVDDLRPSLACFGDKIAITPNIDRLAKRGFIFENAYSQQALCAPSRTSFLTSRRPDSLHLYDAHSYWRKSAGNFTTIPQHFKNNGYHTVSIGKVFHPGIVSGHSDDYPLSWSQTPFHASTEKYKRSKVCYSISNRTTVPQENIVCPVDISDQPERTLPDLQGTQYAIEFLKTYNTSKPLFLAIGFHKPHIPLKYPKEYLDFFPLAAINLAKNRHIPSKLPKVAWNPFDDLRERDDIKNLNISYPFGLIPDYYQLYIRQSYYAAITYIDQLIGKLIETFESKAMLDNTMIILFGDHGWSLGEHGEWSKYSNFDVAVKVPLIFVMPPHLLNRTANGLRISEFVELVDVFPTLADIAGIEVPPLCPENSTLYFCTEGISWKDLINKKLEKILSKGEVFVPWKQKAFSQYPRPSLKPQHNSDQPKLDDIKIMGYSMKKESLRYTEWIEFNRHTMKGNWSNVYARELYFDNEENLNVAGEKRYKEAIKNLSKELRDGWRKVYVEKMQNLHRFTNEERKPEAKT